MKSTLWCLFLPLFRSFALLIASMTILVVGSVTSSNALAASPPPKSAHAVSTSPGLIQRSASTLSAGNGVTPVVSPPTRVVFFSPSGIRGTFNGPADCQMTSLAAPRADAWRCGIEHAMYDPCFSTSAQANYVICDTDPAGDGRGLKAMLAHPFPAPGPYRSGQGKIRAWAMRLSDGSVCTAANGATGQFGGERLNYSCTSGWWIVGFPRSGSVWMVRLVKEGQSPPTQPVLMSVLEAWW